MRIIIYSLFAALAAVSCMEYGAREVEEFRIDLDPRVLTGKGLFIVNEGNFMYGNASLTYYDTEAREALGEVFVRANGIPLGDVGQSMTVKNGLGWVVVNNSGVIFAIDINTFRLAGSITGFTSPRYIHFVDDDKAYVTQLWDERICVVDPRRFRITGYINTGMEPGRQSTEQMVAWGKYLFVSCWSYNSSVLVVDTETDTIVERIDVGAQPNSMALDAHGKLWVMCEGIVGGAGVASLWRVDARTRQVESVLNFAPGDTPRGLIADGAGETLYFINRDVWKMPVASERLPETPFIRERRTKYYSLTVNPINSEVYVADAIDYVQPGIVFRYSPDGEPMDEFRGGITPGGFCWR